MAELTLILNACEKRMQFVLLQDETFLCAEESEPQKNGTDSLLPHIRHACAAFGFKMADIKKTASAAGPGNFMGIRLTATISAALARANGGLQAGINYMQALCFNCTAEENKIIHVVTAATRELVHSQCFRIENGMPAACTELALVPFESLGQIPCDCCLGSGIRTEKALNALQDKNIRILPPFCDSPSINGLVQCLKTAVWHKEDISPVYLKECDAIQNLPHIAKLLGQDPKKSRDELERLLNS